MGKLACLTASLTLLFLLSALWSSNDHLQRLLGLTWSKPTNAHVGFPLRAELSACHPSLTDAGYPITCCPPRKDADQEVVDFDFSDYPRSATPRVRRPAHRVDPDAAAKYLRTVELMKSLPLDHPHNFFRQANNHCLYCTGSYDQVNASSLFKIHRSWLFFPWHRAFLFFHERILGKLVNDSSFSIPYWQWDHPEGMSIPDIFTRGSLTHSQRDGAHLPPDVADLNYDVIKEKKIPREQVAENLAFMYNQMVSGAKKTELFMGCKLTAGEEGYCNGPGTVEDAPHNTLHTWVGSALNREREDMGAFYSAARDPIFYAHHSNIDRLWDVWRDLRGREAADFQEEAWLDSAFTFYDENLRFVRIKVRDCLDIGKLGYAYEDAELPWLNARPKPAMAPKLARELLDIDVFGPEEGRERVLDKTVRVKVRRSRRGRTEKEKEEEEEVLVVYGIRMSRDTYAKFDVFVNMMAGEEKAGPLAREFAGAFVNTPRGATPVRAGRRRVKESAVTLKLGISELLKDLEAELDESIWVSLVPRGPSGANVTVEGVRIEFMR